MSDATIIATAFSGFVLLVVHLLPWTIERDVPMQSSPSKLSAVVSGLHGLPHFLIVWFDPQLSPMYNLVGDSLYALMAKFALLYSAGFVAFLIALKIVTRAYRKSYTINLNLTDAVPHPIRVAVFATLLYLGSMVLIFSEAGGLAYYFENFAARSDLMMGTGIYYVIKVPAAYLAILFLVVSHAKNDKPNFVILLTFILAVAIIESSIGSRRTPMQFFLFAVVALMILKPSLRWTSPANLISISFVLVFFVILLLARDVASTAQESRGLLSFIANFSYNDIYFFTLHHFNSDNFWLGRVFLDFQYRFYTSPYVSQPPSLDEGVYIYNLFIGNYADPPMPLEMLYRNSWPPNTFGNGYANFGAPGVIVFFAIKGIITGLVYNWHRRSPVSPTRLFMYLLILFSFQISNQKFVELFVVLAGLAVLSLPIIVLQKLGGMRSA